MFFQFCLAQNVKQQLFIKTYTGSLAGKYPIEMRLVNWGYGGLVGDYFYQKVGEKITLYGDFEDEQSFTLTEYADGENTGTFRGRFSDENTIKGTWSNPQGTRTFDFSLTAKPGTTDDSNWAGVWHLNEIWDGGTLLIGNVTKESLEFAISVTRSTHMGEMWGTASRDGDQAIFKSLEFDYEGSDSEPCHLTFELRGDHILVDQLSSTMACGFGVRAYAGGRFDNRIIEKKPTLSVGDDDYDVFPAQKLHDDFKKLVGAHYYEIFAYNMQATQPEEPKPLDGARVRTVTGMVIGLFGSNEAIIMYDEHGKIWAATLDQDEAERFVIRYFTNDSKYQLKFPPQVAEWIDRYPDYPVRYE